MSQNNIFNPNKNSLINTNVNMNYEPDANQSDSRVVFGIEKKLMSFNIDPNILHIGLNNYLNQQSYLLSKKFGENQVIKEIITKIDELSNNLMKVVLAVLLIAVKYLRNVVVRCVNVMIVALPLIAVILIIDVVIAVTVVIAVK